MVYDGATSELGHDDAGSVSELNKALRAGYGTDSATFINGRAMIAENLESTMISIVAENKDECKVLNTLKKVPVTSTIHEKNRRTSHGEYRFLSTAEYGDSIESDQAIERVIYMQKYLQTKRGVSRQMELARTWEDAYTSEKIAGIEVVSKAIEYNIFHGDSSIVPTDFDGFLASIKRSADPNIIDLRGATLGSVGEGILDQAGEVILERGGDASIALFPPKLAKDVKALFSDRLRLLVKDSNASFESLPDYPTGVGSIIRLSGDGAGTDKFYHVKGEVKAAGNALLRPEPPTTVVLSAVTGADATGSQFLAAEAGAYKYTVHAVNANGISDGRAATATGAVTAGNGIRVRITVNASKPCTGFIITRSKKGGEGALMEMTSVGCPAGAATVDYIDLNKELPGTASMLVLTEKRFTPTFELGQLLPISTYPLYPVNRAETPFLVMFYGALEVNAPEHCAIINNIAYSGGLY